MLYKIVSLCIYLVIMALFSNSVTAKSNIEWCCTHSEHHGSTQTLRCLGTKKTYTTFKECSKRVKEHNKDYKNHVSSHGCRKKH